MTEKMPPKIASALVKATREAEAVEKGRRMQGEKYGYNFAGADALMEEARTALSKAGLAIVLMGWDAATLDRHDWAVDGTGPKGEDPPYTNREFFWVERRVVASFALVHEETGDSHRLDPVSMPSLPGVGKQVDKADAAALTYATGYVMRGLLNLPRVEPGQQVDERDDSEHAPKGRPKGPTAEEKREAAKEAALVEIESALSTVTDLVGWIGEYGAKATKAVGMEAVRTLVGRRVVTLGVAEGPVLAELAKVVAASKKSG